MRRLFNYVKSYKLESILGPLFKMSEASFELFMPLMVARMVDVGIRGRDSGYILRTGGVLVLLAPIDLACSLAVQCFTVKTTTGATISLRNDLFSHVGGSSYTEIDTVGTVAFITRIASNINQVQSGVSMTLCLLLRSPFMVSGTMAMALTANVCSAFVFAVAVPVLCVMVFGIMAVSMPFYRFVQGQLDKVLLTIRGNLLGVWVICAFNRQKSETEKFDQENGSLIRMQAPVEKISALLNPVTCVIVNIAVVAVIWVGAEQVDSAVLTQGKVTAPVNYMSQILVELIEMASLIIIISKAAICMNRVDGVFQAESNIEDGGTFGIWERRSQASKIEFKDMGFIYAKAKEPALQGTSFHTMVGQTIGVVGGTGSEESTLVNLISRFCDAASGQVLVDGTGVKDYPLDGLGEKMGAVPQKSVLFKGVLRDNMRWGKQDTLGKGIYRALDTARAREFVDPRGEGLDLYTDQGGHNLSGGQHQRLIMARALVRKPKMLIVDDSAPALDYATDTRLRGAIRESVEDIIVFAILQRATTIKDVDTTLVLDEGRLAGVDTYKELFKGCQVYREICLLQLSKEGVRRDEQ